MARKSGQESPLITMQSSRLAAIAVQAFCACGLVMDANRVRYQPASDLLTWLVASARASSNFLCMFLTQSSARALSRNAPTWLAHTAFGSRFLPGGAFLGGAATAAVVFFAGATA